MKSFASLTSPLNLLKDNYIVTIKNKMFIFFVFPGSLMHTNAVLLVQIDVQDSLQTMLEGSYKSGKH